MAFPAAIDELNRLRLERIKKVEAETYAKFEVSAAANLAIEDPDWNEKPLEFRQQAIKSVADRAFYAMLLQCEIEIRDYDASAYR